MVGYFDYTSEMTLSFEKARDGMLGAMHGTLLSEDSISLGGSPGKHLKIFSES